MQLVSWVIDAAVVQPERARSDGACGVGYVVSWGTYVYMVGRMGLRMHWRRSIRSKSGTSTRLACQSLYPED